MCCGRTFSERFSDGFVNSFRPTRNRSCVGRWTLNSVPSEVMSNTVDPTTGNSALTRMNPGFRIRMAPPASVNSLISFLSSETTESCSLTLDRVVLMFSRFRSLADNSSRVAVLTIVDLIVGVRARTRHPACAPATARIAIKADAGRREGTLLMGWDNTDYISNFFQASAPEGRPRRAFSQCEKRLGDSSQTRNHCRISSLSACFATG